MDIWQRRNRGIHRIVRRPIDDNLSLEGAPDEVGRNLQSPVYHDDTVPFARRRQLRQAGHHDWITRTIAEIEVTHGVRISEQRSERHALYARSLPSHVFELALEPACIGRMPLIQEADI